MPDKSSHPEWDRILEARGLEAVRRLLEKSRNVGETGRIRDCTARAIRPLSRTIPGVGMLSNGSHRKIYKSGSFRSSGRRNGTGGLESLPYRRSAYQRSLSLCQPCHGCSRESSGDTEYLGVFTCLHKLSMSAGARFFDSNANEEA